LNIYKFALSIFPVYKTNKVFFNNKVPINIKMAEINSSHPAQESPNRCTNTRPNGEAPNSRVQNVNQQKLTQQSVQQSFTARQSSKSVHPTPALVCFDYKQQFVKTLTAGKQPPSSPASVHQYPQIVYLPQPAQVSSNPVASCKPPLCLRQTCYEVILKSVVHVWYFVYICAFLFGVYTYRLPARTENLKLQIELAKVRLREEEVRSNARVREAEINRDLTVDVEKLKLANNHARQMESLKISQELAEKYLESNVEVKEMSSGFFSKETTTQKKTFLESADTTAFAKLFKGYNEWDISMLTDTTKHLTDESSISVEDDNEEEGEEADDIEIHLDL
jgi:hypothetical protein